MPAALWGAVTALCWGGGDFLSRFTGGRLGVLTAMAGVMSSSFLLLALFVWWSGEALRFPTQGWPALGIACLGIVAATGLLYLGMIRGPVSLVAPIVAAYPVWSLLLAVLGGVHPARIQWAAMALVIVGVVAVARLGGTADAAAAERPGGLPLTLVVSFLASLGFAGGIAGLQTAGPHFGELQSLLAIRLFGVVATLAGLAAMPQLRRPIPWRWWPVLLFQGTIDGTAYLALLIGGQTAGDAPVAVVVASTFCVVPVVLGRIFLKEHIGAGQWVAILAIVAGVATLSAV
ncbi:MAG: DMT family transporter [Rhodospirillales bacterium]|nr:DMT family transporter [Rhodospirillales bacterium]